MGYFYNPWDPREPYQAPPGEYPENVESRTGDFLSKYGSLLNQSGRRGAQARSSLAGTSVLDEIAGNRITLDDPFVQLFLSGGSGVDEQGFNRLNAPDRYAGLEKLEGLIPEIADYYGKGDKITGDLGNIYDDDGNQVIYVHDFDYDGIRSLVDEYSASIDTSQEAIDSFAIVDENRARNTSLLDDIVRAGQIDTETAQAIIDEGIEDVPNLKAQIDLFNDPTKKKKNPLDPLQGSTSIPTTGPKRI